VPATTIETPFLVKIKPKLENLGFLAKIFLQRRA
jgi:hypothetical protein